MDDTIEKKILEESQDFSILSLFLQADIVVKLVIITLLISSIWSWTIIFTKYAYLKSIMLDTNDFEERFYSSETLSKLSKSVGNQPGHPIEAVFFSAMVYFEKVKSGFNNKNFEFDEYLLLENKGAAIFKLNSLLSEKIVPACSSCGKQLEQDTKFAICEECYKNRVRFRPRGSRSFRGSSENKKES